MGSWTRFSVDNLIAANVPYFWTSGRLCDFDGCDRPDLFPKNINGWFWSSNQVAMPPTNSTRAFHDWSHTGGAGQASAGQQGGDAAARRHRGLHGRPEQLLRRR